MKYCEHCNKPFHGSKSAKFCNDQCRGQYHKNRRKTKMLTISLELRQPEEKDILTLFASNHIEQVLKNRQILKDLFKSGKQINRFSNLMMLGYNPKHITSQELFKNTNTIYCFDYAIVHYGITSDGKPSDAIEILHISV